MKTKQIAKLSQGRKKWCVLFFHPKLSDTNGKPRRVRYGIGTENRDEADKILADLNAVLANEDLWSPGAKEIALRSYHPTAVACFYDGIEGKIVDPWIKREEVIELPKKGFSIVQLTGPIGAGKTTLVRQLIGTDPEERFPATSKSRTTIFDTEIICSPGHYHAVVSFLSPERVRSYVEECVQAAVMAVAEGLSKDSIARRFLEHSEQKFRLSYILGSVSQAQDDDEDSDEPLTNEEQPDEISEEERQENGAKLVHWLNRCEKLAERIIHEVEEEVGETAAKMTENDKDAFLQLVSDKLVDDEDLHIVVDEVVDAIETRFPFVKSGEFDFDSSGWPLRWRYQSENRPEFLKQVRWFASNHAPLFGRLLTPLVEGLRVKGPFAPTGWSDETDVPPIVLLDGVGLGHSRGTGVQISTSITRRFELAHAIVLVDDATKPMLDAAQALLRTVTASGQERKFAIVFTNFDRMEGDNFGNDQDKRSMVLAAVEQGILSVETALDGQSGAGRRLRRVLDSGRVLFVGGIHERIDEGAKKTRKTRKELNALLTFMRAANQPEQPTEVTLCYDLGFLASSIRKATEPFQKYWNGRLGLGYHEGVKAEHWTRVKALSRRFAYQWSDEYDTMQPVAHLLGLLKEKITGFAASPREWKPSNASIEAKDAAIARVSAEVSKRLEGYVARRMREEHLTDWNTAYSQRDKGSAQRRATYIRSINEDVAAVPDEVPAPLAAKLLDDFRSIFREAANAAGAEIIAG